MHVPLINGKSMRGWDIFSIRCKSSLREVDDFFSHEKLSAKKRGKLASRERNTGDSASSLQMF